MSKRSSNSLRYAVNRAALSGSKSHQHRVRQNARNFVSTLQESGCWVEKWTNVTNKHFQRVADTMKENGISDGRIAEVFSAARHICETYGNERISSRNADFGVQRGSITNTESKAVDPEKIEQIIHDLEQKDQYEHAPRCAAQFRLQYELGLRREEAAKVDLINDWNREDLSLMIQYGTKGGRPRLLENLSERQEQALEKATAFISESDRQGIYNLMPAGMGDSWQNCLEYAARKHGLTKKDSGFTLHGNRHERFHQMYLDIAGFEPPNQFPSLKEFQQNAHSIQGESWPESDSSARDEIEQTAGHSKGRRDISNAYLGSSY